MPFDEVMKKYKAGKLRSGESGAQVTNPKQAVAIMLSEKKKAQQGDTEYQPKGAMQLAHRRGRK